MCEGDLERSQMLKISIGKKQLLLPKQEQNLELAHCLVSRLVLKFSVSVVGERSDVIFSTFFHK